nr:CAP domain-containing protein [Candidatus Hydrogenedentota bacterium]
LVMNETLRKVARAHSQDMVDRDFFSHTSPDGGSLGDRLAGARVSYVRAGENIAWNRGYANPVTVAVEGWMASPGHRANILRPEFALTGIGIAVAPDDAWYFTQVFIDPSKSRGMDHVEIYTSGPIAITAP